MKPLPSCALLALPLLALPACRESPKPAAQTTTAAPIATATAAVTATPTASAAAKPAPPKPRVFSFDKDKSDDPPPGFDFFATSGKPGKWAIKGEAQAASAPNVLAQLDDDKKADRFAMAIAREPKLRDARISVRCRTISGKVEQSSGVVLRFQDEKNYYLAALNALEKDVTLYAVKDGKRKKLGGWKGATIGTAWHELRLDAREERFELSWDGTRVYEAADTTHIEAGRVGLWTKADSVTYFDDLTVTALEPPAAQ